MESWLGGGVLLLVAAALWLVYLVPNWLRRSEYLATERNAVRLQQTIRVLAETAETPEAVRIESAARARKAVAETLAARPVAVGTASRLPLPMELDPRARAARRLRRTRLAMTFVLLAGVAVLGWQVFVMVGGGLAAGSTMLVAIAGLVVIGGGVLQGRLGRAARARSLSERSGSSARVAAARPTVGTDPRRAVGTVDVELDAAVPEDRVWTPQPLPQPLGRMRREAAIAAARAEALRIAAAGHEETARSVSAARVLETAQPVEARPNPAPVLAERFGGSGEPPRSPGEAARPSSESAGRDAAPVVVARAPSRFAAMGVVTVPTGSGIDLDSALARRRAS